MESQQNVDDALRSILRYEEVLGAVALSREGLVLGTAAIDEQDADWIGALGASLVGAADRTARRLGAGTADNIIVGTSDGMIHLRSDGEFAVMVFTEQCDPGSVTGICEQVVGEIKAVLTAR